MGKNFIMSTALNQINLVIHLKSCGRYINSDVKVKRREKGKNEGKITPICPMIALSFVIMLL